MADQAKVLNKVVSVTGMSVAGGDLPKNFQVYTNVKFDFTGVPEDDLIEYNCAGSSIRVKAQAKMRKWTTAELLKHGIQSPEGYDADAKIAIKDKPYFTFIVDTDFEKEETGPRDPVKTAQSAFKKMDAQTQYDYMIGLGVAEEVARLTAFPPVVDEEEQSETNES